MALQGERAGSTALQAQMQVALVSQSIELPPDALESILTTHRRTIVASPARTEGGRRL
jgi:hypothetical protein